MCIDNKLEMETDCERVETFLAGRIPDLVPEHAVLEPAFLREEGSADSRLLVRLELVRHLLVVSLQTHDKQQCEEGRTKRSTTDDFPTAASPE